MVSADYFLHKLFNFKSFTMKKLLLCLLVVAFAASCTTVQKSATTLDVETSVTAKATADLVVSGKKVSYTMSPSKSIRKAGVENVKNTAVSELLKKHDADVLVAPEFSIVRTKNIFFRTFISEITVTGYPAKYANFKK